ncbi:hypothetical protein [Bacillus infantis]|uniref:hypothetical protein n=1 Tax=Bacillus infantis TaxID=324767 RepID=UPI003CE7A590
MTKKEILSYYQSLMVNVFRNQYKGNYTKEQAASIIKDFTNNLVGFSHIDEEIAIQDAETIIENAIVIVKDELGIEDDKVAKEDAIKKELYLLYSSAVSQFEFAFNDISGSGYFPVDPMMYGKYTKQKELNRVNRLKNFIAVKSTLNEIKSQYFALASKNVKYLNGDDRKLALSWRNELLKLISECDIFIEQSKELVSIK